MKYTIVNPYSNADTINQSVCKYPFKPTELTALLKEGTGVLYPRQERLFLHKRAMTNVEMFADFLKLTRNGTVTVDEGLFEEFRDFFGRSSKGNRRKSYEPNTINKAVDVLRSIFNEYLHPKGYISRKILCKKPYEKYKTFHGLSESTKKLLLAYEKDGRKINTKTVYYEDPKTQKETHRLIVQRRHSELSDKNRTRNIANSIRILVTLGKSGLEDLTRHDLERLLQIARKKDVECAACGYLASLRSVIANGIALGILNQNPFNGFDFEEKRYAPRQDFIMPDQMDKLLDLDSLKWEDFMAVRNRCVTLVGYDTALRASTLAMLDDQCFVELSNGEYQIKVKGIHLKGGKKADEGLGLLFDATIQILKYWTNVARPKLNPKCNALFVSHRGEPLTDTGIRDIVRDCCGSLGVQTLKGLVPTPHTLRHSFATLNIEPYGKSLSTREMQERLIHVSLDTVENTYIHKNPYARMNVAKERRQKDSRIGALGRVSQEEFFGVLEALSFAKPTSINDIKTAYRKAIENKRSSNRYGGAILSEHETLEVLSPFSLDYRSLRSWALKDGICQIEDGNGNRQYFYQKMAIEDLAKKYMAAHQAFKKFGVSRSYFNKKVKGCARLTIGKQTLIPRSDLMEVFIDKSSN